MSASAQPMTLADFLRWERGQHLRYEFNGFAPVAMTGGTIEHSQIATNIVEALGRRLRGGPCRVFRGDVKIIVDGRVRYPDAVVTCAPTLRGTDVIPEPIVVFEVLSASTAGVDRITKNAEYRDTPSIMHYVMVEQVAVGATVFSRDGAEWRGRLLTSADTLGFPEIGVTLPLADCYAGVELPETPEE